MLFRTICSVDSSSFQEPLSVYFVRGTDWKDSKNYNTEMAQGSNFTTMLLYNAQHFLFLPSRVPYLNFEVMTF